MKDTEPSMYILGLFPYRISKRHLIYQKRIQQYVLILGNKAWLGDVIRGYLVWFDLTSVSTIYSVVV